LKFFPDSNRNAGRAGIVGEVIRLRGLPAALLVLCTCGVTFAGWQARAALPRWMQDVVGSSSIEAALYRVMEIPGAKALYPRPPKEAQSEVSGLIGKAPEQANLYSLRAMGEEQALDFGAAEADWKAYAARAKDTVGAKLELADFYHRRLQAGDEVKALMEVGSSPALVSEQYTAPAEQRSWKAFERLMLLAADQGLDEDMVARGYAAWIARYPNQPSIYTREFRWWLDRSKDQSKDGKKIEQAEEVIRQYRRAFPGDAVFPLKAAALLEYRRGAAGSIDKALAIYDGGFEPLWPAELVESYYALLTQTHRQRRFLAEARARLVENPDDLNAMARLFYSSQQQGNLEAAQQIVEAYRLSKDSRKAVWSAQELYTLASLMEAIHAYPEAARYDFALYHAQGSLASGDPPQEEGLSGIVRILLRAPDQPVELGAGNLSMYRDIATLDRGPGYWNGILSLWLNSESPQQSYHEEEQRAQPYFHRAKAAELLAALDKEYPKAAQRAELHKELIRVLADYGESSLVLKAGNDFLSAFSSPSNESNRVLVAMYMADAYARQQDSKGEFALYDRMLTELGARTAGMPLTAAAASDRGSVSQPSNGAQPEEGSTDETSAGTGAENGGTETTTKKVESSRAFEIGAGQPTGVFVAGSQEYQRLLERYLGRLTATGQSPQALAVLRKELDRNPNDPLLYERLANFLQQNNLSAQQEEVYSQAIQKFQDKGWYDKLARLYLHEKKREAFAGLTKQVTEIFQGTDLEEYFRQVSGGGPQLFLQLNLYAHQRFPHDEVFVNNLLAAYKAKTTYDAVAWEKLLREHWSDSEQLREQFFDFLSRSGRLDAELAQLHTLTPDAREQKANPDATRELAEVEIWRSHFEESAPLLASLAEAYPADEEIGTRASSVFRSLAYFDTSQTERAVSVEKHLLAANPADLDRMARIGDIYADSGADSTPGHEDIAAAATYWRRMPGIHPGNANGYLQAATIFWDYFQFDDALEEIREARAKFGQPALYGYEAGAIYEGKRDLANAIHEYTAAAIESNTDSFAGGRLLQLARRKASAKMVEDETAKAVESGGSIAALELRERVLTAQKREAEIRPLLETALGKATIFEQAQAVGAQAQAHALTPLYELAVQREIALANDPVQKIELSYELARSFEGRKDLEDATRWIDQIYRENPKLLGVVRSTTDFYWRNQQPAKAIGTLIEAADAAKTAQPALSRQFVVEAAGKANDSGNYAQARSLMAPLIDPQANSADDATNAQYLAVVADSYARPGDDAGLKQFYLDKLAWIRSASSAMTADERKQKTVLLRRGLIPALTRLKDYAGAVDQYIAILSAYPEDASAAQEASLYALRYGRQPQLVEFVSNTVKASPRDSRFAILLAQIETTFEDYPVAIDTYAHAISIRADRADLFAAKAGLEERLQRLDDACKEYERLYVLSYRNPDWMVKVAAVRARQGRKEDAVQALQHAWIDGHPSTANDYFRVATQLESWNMLDESLHFAELGVKAEGDALLAGGEPGNRNGDDASGAAIYVRLLTRMRQQEKALTALDAALAAADASPNSPGIVVEQVEKQGLASVTNEEWRKRRIEQRRATATERFHGAVLEMGKTVGAYFTPEEKQQFASLVKRRSGPRSGEILWAEAAHAAGITDEEERLRKQMLLEPSRRVNGSSNPQFATYLQLERSRMEYRELAQTTDVYAETLKPGYRTSALIAEAAAYRNAGDEAAEFSVLRKIGFDQGNDAGERERYLQLLLKYDIAGFVSLGESSRNEEIAFAAANYAVEHSDLTIARTALRVHAKTFQSPWENAYTALLGLYFRDQGADSEGAFHGVLGDQRTIGERIQSSSKSGANPGGPQLLAGDIWFYYGMRYGVYRTLWPEKEWPQRDPEDFLAADLERSSSTANYLGLARAYADAGKTDAALAEYHHALELTPDSPAIYDAMAMLLWSADKKDEAIARWRDALATLNRIQDKGPAPESFWSEFALITQHLSGCKLIARLRPDLDAVLRNYLTRNGNYRSNELLQAAFLASASPGDGVNWIVSLSSAAADPAGVLADIDSAAWLPAEDREAVLLREMELAQIAAAHKDQNDYAVQLAVQLERSLMLYYVGQKQDAKAEALLEKLSSDQRKDGEIVMAQIELAARGHRLGALLSSYLANPANELPGTEFQLLRNAAAKLAREGDKTDALMLWEFVFDRLQSTHDLMVSDYMGVAKARLEVGNTAGAVELLRRMTLMPGDGQNNNVMANYGLAATLLEEKGCDSEAIEFLMALVKGVPWNSSYSLRLAEAQLRAGNKRSEAAATLASIAADSTQVYQLRVKAAVALRGENGGTATLGSEELRLLASGKITAQQAERPYFFAARIAAAESVSDFAQQAVLLRQAIAVSPAGLADAAGFTGDDLRLKIFHAEAAAGHYATAFDAIEPLLNKTNSYSGPAEDANAASAGGDSASDDGTDESAEGTGSMAAGAEMLAELERLAPLPLRGAQTDAGKISLACLIAQVYQETGSPASALPYLKLAAYLEKDVKLHAELQRHVDLLSAALRLEAENSARQPHIQSELNQSGVVRPRLSAAELARKSSGAVTNGEAQ
jgi:cellulose synthase operon protein C